jgi:hypothetical protein
MMLMLRRLWVQLTADRKKFAALCVMVGLGLLLWARLIVISNMPRTALAEEEASVAAETPAPQATEVSDNRPTCPVPVALAFIPQRDPFVISDRHFPKPTSVGDLETEPAKSGAQQAEDPKQAEARLRAQIQALVDQFTLDAALSSASLAVIGGRTYQQGARVPAPGSEQISFTLAEVRQRSVVLVYEGRRFELKMSGPGG